MYGDKPLKELVGDAFVVGCVARNQHRKNIPILFKGFKEFVERNELKPKDVRLIMHMDWNDAMGWPIPDYAKHYGIEDYLLPPMMGVLDLGQALSEEGLANLYNCMDIFVLPTAGEGFGIPTVEAMSCGVPVAVTDDREAGTQAAIRNFERYGNLPSYQNMLKIEGRSHPSQAAIIGNEAEVEREIRAYSDVGTTEFLASPFPVGSDEGMSLTRTRALLKSLVGRI